MTSPLADDTLGEAPCGLLRAFHRACLSSGGHALLAVSPHYLSGNWAAQPLMASLDFANALSWIRAREPAARVWQVQDAADPGFLIEFEAAPDAAPDAGQRSAGADGERLSRLLPGHSRLIRNLRRHAALVRSQAGHVLLSGEPGTGKRSLAEWLLACATDVPARCIDCATDPQALAVLGAAIRQGQPAVLLHVCELPQAGLPQVLATLDEASRRGLRVVLTVRPNLPLRLQALAGRVSSRLWLPPLRDRLEDIPDILAAWPATRRSPRPRANAEALRRLWAHDWPGNLRELARVLREGSSRLPMATSIDERRPGVSQALAGVPGGTALAVLPALQKRVLQQTLKRCQGNRSRAAVLLGVSRATLYRKLDRYGIRPQGAGG